MAKIQGVAKKFDGTKIDYVQVFNWSNGKCITVAATDVTGNWSANLYGLINVGLTYVANGCEPITHGAYSFDFPFDASWSTVSLLLHLDDDYLDAKNINTFTKSGVANFGAGRFDKALEFLPVSSTSVNGLLESTVSNPNLSLGTGDFTIELFVKPSASYKQSSQALISLFTVNTLAGWQVYLPSLKPSFYMYNNLTAGTLASSSAITVDEWSHIAVCRQSGVSYLYVNGVMKDSLADTRNYSSTDTQLSIGYQVSGSARYPLTGMLDEIRITKGLARYTANFTPPTAPHPHAHS